MLNFIIGFLVCWAFIGIFALVGEAKEWYEKDLFWCLLALPIVLPVLLFAGIGKFFKCVIELFGL